MMQLTLEGETPLLPEGYRWLLRGEQKNEGDWFADMEALHAELMGQLRASENQATAKALGITADK